MKMLCHDEYIFGRRRWSAGAGGCDLLRSSVMCCELFFITKMSVLEVCDHSGEGREVHGDATNCSKDSGEFFGSKCPIS